MIRTFIVISIGLSGRRGKPPIRRALLPLITFLLLIPPAVQGQASSPLERSGSIEVTVEPEEAVIFVDNQRVGTGSVEIEELPPGNYKVEARLGGYYGETRFVNLRPRGEISLELVLQEVVGYLEVETEPGDAKVFLGESPLEGFPVELPVGTYDLRIRRFGYLSETRRVEIREKETTTLRVELLPAPFEITDLRLSRERFNPLNQGEVGTTTLSFRVSSYGEALFLLYREGQPLLRRQIGPFESWRQQIVWDGRDEDGTPLPDGSYTYELRAEGRSPGRDEPVTVSLRGDVHVDRRIVSRYRSLFSGSSGLLFAPMAEPLGPGSTQVSTEGLAFTLPDDRWYAPIVIGTRFGLGIKTAISATAGPLISSREEQARIAGSLAFDWRYLFLPGRFAMGTVLKGSVASPVDGSYGGRDERTNPTGVGFQHPITLYLGRFYLTFAPELHYGPDGVSYDPQQSADGGIWSYLRAGLGYDGDILSLGLSGALRSSPFSQEIDYNPPIPLAAEGRFRLPTGPLHFSLILAGDLYPREGEVTLKGGFGAGILF